MLMDIYRCIECKSWHTIPNALPHNFECPICGGKLVFRESRADKRGNDEMKSKFKIIKRP